MPAALEPKHECHYLSALVNKADGEDDSNRGTLSEATWICDWRGDDARSCVRRMLDVVPRASNDSKAIVSIRLNSGSALGMEISIAVGRHCFGEVKRVSRR